MHCLVIGLLILLAVPAKAQTWLAESERTFASTNTGWGGMAFEPGGERLFMARRDDGLLVWNVKTGQAVTVENSKGATGIVLVPRAGRGYAPMADGTVLAFELSTLRPIERSDLGAGDLDAGFYEPTFNRVYFLTGARPEKTVWVGLDASSGKVVSRAEFNSKKMDTPASDGEGGIFAPQRDRGLLQHLDAQDLSIKKTWKLGDCSQPAVVRWEMDARRVLVACQGEKPVFVALDPAAGIVATVPIGGGVGGMVVDPARHLIVTANGADGTFSVIRQEQASKFGLVETIATRPMTRVLAIDETSQRLFTVTASYTQPVASADGKPPALIYHPDSFAVLVYRPANPAD